MKKIAATLLLVVFVSNTSSSQDYIAMLKSTLKSLGVSEEIIGMTGDAAVLTQQLQELYGISKTLKSTYEMTEQMRADIKNMKNIQFSGNEFLQNIGIMLKEHLDRTTDYIDVHSMYMQATSHYRDGFGMISPSMIATFR